MKIMAVDPSLRATGVALPSGETKLIEPAKMGPYSEGTDRVAAILWRVSTWMEEYKPTHICLEDYAYGVGKSGRLFDIGELGGCLKLLFLSRGLPIILVPPTVLKKFVTGKGNASKQEVMRDLKQKWGRSFVSSDMADAYALRLLAMQKVGVRVEEGPGDRSVLGKVTILRSSEFLKTIAIKF